MIMVLPLNFNITLDFFASSVLEPGRSSLSTKVSPDLGSLFMYIHNNNSMNSIFNRFNEVVITIQN